jgi:predicted AAA+ superfamily ATPase
MILRRLSEALASDLDTKIVLLSGPRQAGKTFLSRQLFSKSQVYLNFDSPADRAILRERSWDRQAELVIFDELHKWKNWKRWIKGVYDTEGVRPRLLVTGSARMDVFRKGGESLAGRHFNLRLHPFSLREVTDSGRDPDEALSTMLEVGAFPEPFLKGAAPWANRWRRSHLDRILREDLLDLERVRDIRSIELLVDLLAERVGTPISYSSLARDLEVSPHTVKHWIEILERLYVVFLVTPYSKSHARSLLKEPKCYFYDTGRVRNDAGARFENTVACHLLKRCHHLEDTEGERMVLHYVRDKEKREVDFLTVRNQKPEYLIEAKLGDADFSTSLVFYQRQIRPVRTIQLVQRCEREKTLPETGVELRAAARWLSKLEA